MDPLNLPPRYRLLGRLGAGASADVLRVHDAELDRAVAMKLLRPGKAHSGTARRRFQNEARILARLQHPGVVPVFERGALADGRPFYTMAEVRGRTLGEVMEESREAEAAEGAGPAGWSRRLVEVMLRVCETLAYAHSQGVIHRDLKPSNLMLGPFGEVLVMDWGLARILDEREEDADGVELFSQSADHTSLGSVLGTPATMPPEQARGEVDRLGPPADVYALGAVLYHILAGAPPYFGSSGWVVLQQVLRGPPLPLAERLGPGDQPRRLPPELVAVVEAAMARDPATRYADAGLMARDLGAFLDGVRHRERALGLVAAADQAAPTLREHRARAGALRAQARALLQEIPTWAPADRRAEAWALEDEAAGLERAANALEQARLQDLRAALSLVPDLDEAHQRLADHYQARHAAAEARRDHEAALEAEILLRAHDRGAHAGWLQGRGWLDLITDPPGAEARLYRFESQGRRLVPVFERTLGQTPLVGCALPMGSWLVELAAPGRAPVRYPVLIGREERWDGVPPGEAAAQPIPLPAEGALQEDEILVPPGPALLGGDPASGWSERPRRLWVEGFILQRFPITNQAYLDFLNALLAEGQEDAANRHAPRLLGSTLESNGALLVNRDAQGRFALLDEPRETSWRPDYPITHIDWFSANAFAAWQAQRTGLPWRLPCEFEWEKAARGVDGRTYPWGDHFDASWCCVRESHAVRPVMVSVQAFPEDVSPYGVRGLAGGARDWCVDAWAPERVAVADGRVLAPRPEPDPRPETPRVVRGASWMDASVTCRAGSRSWIRATERYGRVGFRLARPWPPRLDTFPV